MSGRTARYVFAAVLVLALAGGGVLLAFALAASDPVVLGGVRPEAPAVSGGRVVWTDRTYGNADIFMYDAATRAVSRLTTDPADQSDPAISGDIVVWSDKRNGKGTIRALDLATGVQSDVSPNVSDQVRPSISGTWVVWEDYRNSYNPGIYGRDLAGGTERRVASGMGTAMRRPKIAGTLVVWEDYASASGAGDIKSYDLATGETRVIASAGSSELLPATDGRYVVWAEAAAGGMDVMSYDTATGTRAKLSGQRGEQTFPGIAGGTAYWIDNSTGARLHADTYTFSNRSVARYDDAGTEDITSLVMQDGTSAWLARRGSSWRLVARVDASLGRYVTGSLGKLLPATLRRQQAFRPLPVASASQVRPLKVSAISVRHGSRRVDPAVPLRVTFSKPIAPSAANLSHIYLVEEPSGRRVRARVTYDRRTRSARILPAARLSQRLYSVVVDDRIVDASGGQIEAAALATFSTIRTLADVSAPSAPGQVSAKVEGLSSVKISWNPAVDDVGVTGYDVYRSNTATQMSDPLTQGTLVASVAATSATVAVRAGEAAASYTYSYVVYAKDGSGKSTKSLNALPDPHGISSSLTSTCSRCHSVHGGTSSPFLGAASATDCYRCHGATTGTTAYGYNSTFDTQARFQDDSAVATTGPTRGGGSIHRNAFMVTNGHDCDSCHTPHRKPYDPVASASFNRLLRTQVATPVPAGNPGSAYRYNTDAASVGNQMCFDCHGAASDNAQTLMGIAGGPAAYANAGGDHRTNYAATAHGNPALVPVPPGQSPNPAIQCLACHDEHGSKAPRLLGSLDTTNNISKMLYGSTITTVTGNDGSVCYGCHTSGTTNFPNASRTASGYPAVGTWPGKATWEVAYNGVNHTGSFHSAANVAWSGAGVAGGDCKNCHVIHGADKQQTYDILRRDGAGTQALSPASFTFCFKCHGGSGPGADNVARYFPVAAGGTATQTSFSRFGHKTLSAGSLPAGAALPCYDCHNPHGSASAYGLMVVTQSGGTTFTVGDGAGELVMSPGRSAADVREFCFACHTTSDTTKGWNGSAYAVVTAPARVEGIDRTVYSATGAHLKLPPANGHREADTGSCYVCHGADYSLPTSNNVHNPSGGLSEGGTPCYSCHGNYLTMEDNSGATRGNTGSPVNSSVYHHVLGGAAGEGDIAPYTAAHPTSVTDVYCVSCHPDHNHFNTNKGASLRTDIAAAGSSTTNTDFLASGAYGICVSCHDVSLAKQGQGTEQAAVGAASTPLIGGADFDASAHDYTVNSDFGAPNGTFRANCSKCHSDDTTKFFQYSANGFGTHFSTSAGILTALGSLSANPPKEQACYRCHNATASRYGETLSAAAKATQNEFALASRHDLTKVACVNCHNVHEASAANPAADPDNTYNGAAVNTTSTINTYCLKCHDGTLPAQTVNGTTLIPYTVSANATANVGAYYVSAGHGYTKPGAPFTGRGSTSQAAGYTDVTSDWTNDANVLGAPNGVSASSPSDNSFEMRNTFTFPSVFSSIDSAQLTVRSRANGAWGGPVGGPVAAYDVVYPNSDIQTTSFAEGGTIPDADTFRYNEIDDPEPASAHDIDETYINGTGTTEFRAGVQAPAVPANATNISVSLVWTGRDGTSNAQTLTSRIRVGATNWYNFGTTRNPGTTYTTYTDTWATNPAGGAWTPATANSISGLGIDQSGTTSQRITQMYLRIDYTVTNTYDDVWAIQYTTDGSTWNNVVAANNTAEAALTDHQIDLTGILTAANYSSFAVRVIGTPTGGVDNVGTIDWDASTLDLSVSGTDPGSTRADCRDCHEQHGSSLRDLLSTTVDGRAVPAYSDTSDQAQCLACHRSGTATGADDIARYYPASAYGTAAASMTRSGHRTKTAGTLAAGSAVPCRQCHNPHGGANGGYMLAVRTQVAAGVDTFIGDAVGELAMTDAQQTPANTVNVRRFCFSCHTSSDATPQGWNGSADAAVPAGCYVLGIDRRGGVLRVPALPNGVKGHAIADTTYSCYLCHGDDFTQPNSVNVHNPASGESRGGIPCYVCHTVYRDRMEDGSGTEVGASRTTSFHHVLGSATQQGDTITYPTSSGAKTDVVCLSCHVDHNLFSPFVTATNKRGANLRVTMASSAPASTADAVNSDFIPPPPPTGVQSDSTHYATGQTDVTNDWTNDANVLGAPDGVFATSPTDNAFEMRNTFTFPAGITSVDEATLTVRSRANGAWGGGLGAVQTATALATGANTTTGWTRNSGTSLYNTYIDDPIATPDTTTYLYRAATTTATIDFDETALTIPASAQNIEVSVVHRSRLGSTGTGYITGALLYNGTVYTNGTGTFTRPGTTWTTDATVWTTRPTGGAWTAADVNGLIAGFGFSGRTLDALDQLQVTQCYIEVSYQIPTNDDTWAIQYTTNGSTWNNVVAANNTAEGALTDHQIGLTGILTAANRGTFAVRIVGAVVGTADNVGNIQWDSSTLDLKTTSPATDNGRGVCVSCHSVELDKDVANQFATLTRHTPVIDSDAFAGSAHQYYAQSTFTDGSQFKANCSKCHDGEIDGGGMERGSGTTGFQTSADKFSVHYSSAERLLAAMGVTLPMAEEDNCFRCHSTTASGLKSYAGRDWYNAAAMSAVAEAPLGLVGKTYSHDPAVASGLHLPSSTDETSGYLSENRHVECADCHNVHVAASGSHTRGTNLVSPMLSGASGVEPVYSATNWAAPTSYTATSSVTKEYQICFKCHSGSNTNVATWGGTGSQSWTDQGLEFNPNNRSGHPIVATQNNSPGRLAPKALVAGQMDAPWNVNLGNQTMYCSDCHQADSAGSMGPHGSATKWMLAGTKKAWPYNTAAANGSNATSGFRLLGSFTTGTGVDGNFCDNCHQATSNDYHGGASEHDDAYCIDCHIRVPHGGKASRLIAAVGTGTYPGNMPARYAPNGAGSRPNSFQFYRIRKVAPASYSEGDCYMNNSSAGSGRDCGKHTSTGNTTTDNW